jgi:hypothetical protein
LCVSNSVFCIEQIPTTIVHTARAAEPFDATNRNNFRANLKVQASLLRVHPIRVKQEPSRRELGAILDDLMQSVAIPRRVRDDTI